MGFGWNASYARWLKRPGDDTPIGASKYTSDERKRLWMGGRRGNKKRPLPGWATPVRSTSSTIACPNGSAIWTPFWQLITVSTSWFRCCAIFANLRNKREGRVGIGNTAVTTIQPTHLTPLANHPTATSGRYPSRCRDWVADGRKIRLVFARCAMGR